MKHPKMNNGNFFKERREYYIFLDGYVRVPPIYHKCSIYFLDIVHPSLLIYSLLLIYKLK